MKTYKSPRYRLVPYSVIMAATEGNPDALTAILSRYQGYMTKLSLRRLRDDYGNAYYCQDEELRSRLETKLIAGILSFDST